MNSIDQFVKSLENSSEYDQRSKLFSSITDSCRSENHVKYLEINAILKEYFKSFYSKRTAKSKRMRGEILEDIKSISTSIYPKMDSKFLIELILYKISKFKDHPINVVAHEIFPYFSSFNSTRLATVFFHFYAATRISRVKEQSREVILTVFMLFNTRMRKEIIQFSAEAFGEYSRNMAFKKLSSRRESCMWSDLVCDLVKRNLVG